MDETHPYLVLIEGMNCASCVAKVERALRCGGGGIVRAVRAFIGGATRGHQVRGVGVPRGHRPDPKRE